MWSKTQTFSNCIIDANFIYMSDKKQLDVNKDLDDVIIFVKGKDGKHYKVETIKQDSAYEKMLRRVTLK
jgi:hypothetical protein